jgi:hypothetical protein
MRRSALRALGAALVAAALAAGCGGGGSSASPSVDLDGASPALLVASADTAVAMGEPESARRLLLRALRAAPESAFVHLGFGRYYTAIRRYKDAKESLERAAALAPASPEPAYWLGRAYQQAGDLESASSAYAAALRLDPNHAAASAALGPLLGARYEAAGIPGDYALFRGHSSLTRGELALILAVELGADPDRSVWRSDAAPAADEDEFASALGGRWSRAAAARGWITPFADGRYHLDDPVTRGALAIVLAGIERRWGPALGLGAGGAEPDTSAPQTFSDLGPRHYLARVASRAVEDGLPLRGADGRFDPWASVTGEEALLAVRGLARRLGASPVVSGEPVVRRMVK